MTDKLTLLTPAGLARAPGLGKALLALNNAHAQELSWLEQIQLEAMVGQAFLAACVGEAEALLLAFDQGATYDSPNFQWFRSRMARFVYVDRVVVAADARGRGHARALYRDLFEKAGRAGHDQIVCEINSDPPNPRSDAFHASLGFTQIGAGVIHGGAKTVRYMARPLP